MINVDLESKEIEALIYAATGAVGKMSDYLETPLLETIATLEQATKDIFKIGEKVFVKHENARAIVVEFTDQDKQGMTRIAQEGEYKVYYPDGSESFSSPHFEIVHKSKLEKIVPERGELEKGE